MNWRDTQRAFAAAVLDPALPAPEAVSKATESLGEPNATASRFNVYRNNSAVSLTDAIADQFPIVAELVGDEFFAAMARTYVAEHVPSSPVLIHYGRNFSSFIERFAPAETLPFLADVARVEWAWLQAYHATDRESVNAEALQALDPEQAATAKLVLHPSAQLIQSEWPVISIWSAHKISDLDERQQALQQIPQTGECGLIVRPEFEVNVQLVAAAIFTLLAEFSAGASLGGAAGKLNEDEANEFGGMLGYIFSTGAIVSVQPN